MLQKKEIFSRLWCCNNITGPGHMQQITEVMDLNDSTNLLKRHQITEVMDLNDSTNLLKRHLWI